jgi:secreted PhoX family phosphatase
LLDAFQKMETMEHLAHVSLAANQLGSVQVLRPEQITQLKQARAAYIRNASIERDAEISLRDATQAQGVKVRSEDEATVAVS